MRRVRRSPLAATVAILSVIGAIGVSLKLLLDAVVRGDVAPDLGIGRRVRPLGPFDVRIEAPPEVVFDVASAPYGERAPRLLREHVEVLSRSGDDLVARHRTDVGGGRVAITVESVSLERPRRMEFRLLRGPVPHVVESFTFDGSDGSTRMRYEGELGTDLWWLGARWGDVVARSWEGAVQGSMQQVKAAAEARASKHPRASTGSTEDEG